MTSDQAHEQRSRRALRELSKPPIVLGFLVLVQWAAVLVFTVAVRHNGWLFYQGGDQTFHYTGSWFLAGGHLPEAEIGYGWSYLLSPLARVFGPNLLNALPAVVLVQTLVLLPLALYCVYAIAANIGGRLLGYLAAAAWVIAPFAVIPLWKQSYHAEYVEQFLPQAFGLTGMGDFPSMVCLLAAALFCVRALDTDGPETREAVLAGVAAGLAVGIKPANALFLAGALLAFVAARRLRGALTFGIALMPALIALGLWKYRGLGSLPIVTPNSEAMAAQGRFDDGGDVMASGFALDRYVDFDWDRLGENYVDLRSVFWSLPLLQSLPLLGFVLATRRSWPKALLLGGWLGAFVLVKGGSDRLSVDSGDFLRLLMPGLPPLLILAALVPLLVPWLRHQPPLRFQHPSRRAAIVALAVFALVPLLFFAAMPLLGPRQAVHYFRENVKVPVDQGFSIHVRRMGREALVTWQTPASPGVRAFYRVFRSRPVVPAPNPTLPPGRDGVRCVDPEASGYAGVADCVLEMTLLGATRSNRFLDRPPPGPWVYRVGLAANWRDDLTAGDVVLVSAAGRLS
jgi:hypothetical protein